MVDKNKVKQIIMKHCDELNLEDFEKYVRKMNRMFGTEFKVDNFIRAEK